MLKKYQCRNGCWYGGVFESNASMKVCRASSVTLQQSVSKRSLLFPELQFDVRCGLVTIMVCVVFGS